MIRKRLKAVTSVLAFFLCGVPVWYHMTSLNRGALPLDEMREHLGRGFQALPVTVRLWLCTDRLAGGGAVAAADAQVARILAAMESAGVRPLDHEGLRVVATWVGPSGCASADPLRLLCGHRALGCALPPEACPDVFRVLEGPEHAGDAFLQEALEAELERAGIASSPGSYDVFLLDALALEGPGSNGVTKLQLVLGGGRTAWLLSPMWQPDGAFSGTAAQAAAHAAALFSFGRQEPLPAYGLPLLRSGSLKLLASLCVADPPSGACRWDAAWLEGAALRPLLRALEPLGAVEVESQVLLYTRPREEGAWDPAAGAYALERRQLPFFVDPEWNLEPDRAVVAGAAGAEDTLHLVGFVPAPQQRPLTVRGADDGGVLPSFSVESWGAVALLNLLPQGCCEEWGEGNATGRCTRHGALEKHHLLLLARALASELRLSLGLSNSPALSFPGGLKARYAFAEREAFAEWEVDALARHQVKMAANATANTLASLASLLQKLSNLPVPDEVVELVEESLHALRKANASSDDLFQCARNARLARAAADSAFFHPSIMAEHNYPLQHLVAMYMPYFLPVLVQLARAAASELLHWRRGKGSQKAA